jgi:hypothetical protein
MLDPNKKEDMQKLQEAKKSGDNKIIRNVEGDDNREILGHNAAQIPTTKPIPVVSYPYTDESNPEGKSAKELGLEPDLLGTTGKITPIKEEAKTEEAHPPKKAEEKHASPAHKPEAHKK